MTGSIIEKYKPRPEETTKIEKEGRYGEKTKKQHEHDLKWESLKEKASEAKNFIGFLRGRIKVARFEKNDDVASLLEFLTYKYKEYERKGVVNLKRYRGAKNISIIYRPDSVVVRKYAKKDVKDKNSVEEQEYIFQKDEINAIISAINICKNLDPENYIKTSKIEEQYCKIMNIKETKYGEPLFDINGKFLYSHFTRWRIAHYRITILLNILQDRGVIDYNKSGTKVLNNNLSIKEVLNT